MGEDSDPLTTGTTTSAAISHRAILILMAVMIGAGTLAGFAFGGTRYAAGVLFGGVLAFANYIWLDRSTRAIFSQTATASTGLLAARYILRYAVVGAVLWLIYMTDALPVAAVILGLAAFAFAVVVQGLKNITSSSV